MANNGKTLYAAINGGKGIIAMNTADNNMKYIMADYVPLSLTVSKDGNTLYAIGYILDNNNKPVYFIHKYGGLMVVGPPFMASLTAVDSVWSKRVKFRPTPTKGRNWLALSPNL